MFKWIGIGLGVITLVMVGAIVGLFFAPPGVREAIRDIFVIITGFFFLVSVVMLIAVMLGLLYTMNRIEKLAGTNVLPKLDEAMLKMNEVLESTKTLAASAKDTASNAAGTTQFVSERVVSPIIRVSSLFTGVRAAATSLARRDAPERFDVES